MNPSDEYSLLQELKAAKAEALKYVLDLVSEYRLTEAINKLHDCQITTQSGLSLSFSIVDKDEPRVTVVREGEVLVENSHVFPVTAFPKRKSEFSTWGENVATGNTVLVDLDGSEVIKGVEILGASKTEGFVYIATDSGNILKVAGDELNFVQPIAKLDWRQTAYNTISELENGMMKAQWKEPEVAAELIYKLEKALHTGHIQGESVDLDSTFRRAVAYFMEEPAADIENNSRLQDTFDMQLEISTLAPDLSLIDLDASLEKGMEPETKQIINSIISR